MGRYVMSNVLIIPKYKISNSLYNNALVKIIVLRTLMNLTQK